MKGVYRSGVQEGGTWGPKTVVTTVASVGDMQDSQSEVDWQTTNHLTIIDGFWKFNFDLSLWY